jgi:hypothetical protein
MVGFINFLEDERKRNSFCDANNIDENRISEM